MTCHLLRPVFVAVVSITSLILSKGLMVVNSAINKSILYLKLKCLSQNDYLKCRLKLTQWFKLEGYSSKVIWDLL